MLKKTITYTDYNEKTVTEVLYFNVNKTELADQLGLVDELEMLSESLEGPTRELTRAEIKVVLEFVKKLIRMSYGKRSEDGSKFRKTDETWQDFIDSAVYDAFLLTLFENVEEAVNFITGILPKDLVEQAMREAQAEGTTTNPIETVELPTAEPVLQTVPDPPELTDEDLLKMDPSNMTREQLQRAFKLKATAPSN